MGIGASLKKGFGTAAQSVPVIFVMFVIGFIFNVINIYIAPQNALGAAPGGPAQAPTPAVLAAGFVFMLVTVYMQGASLGYIRDKFKDSSAKLSNFFAAGAKNYVKILLLSILVALIIGFFVLIAALLVSLLGPKAQVVSVILALLTASVGIYVLILFFLAPYIMIADNKGVIAALKESAHLVRQNILKVIGIAVTLVALGFSVGLILGVLIAAISVAIKGIAAQLIFGFLSSIVNAYLGFLVSASFMALYYGLSHKEG